MTGYYIHNQKKDGSGVSKKIDAQMKVFREHFEMHELILEKKKENKLQKKIRQKILNRKQKTLYNKALPKIKNPDFIYVRKQILDQDFLGFLCDIKRNNTSCKILMEVPTYPYWNEYPKNKLGERIIEEEKRIIPQLKNVVDLIVDVGNEKELFGIKTINIQNGLDPDLINLSSKKEKDDIINLIAVAKWRDVHGYERIINSLKEYYREGGEREIALHMVGDGPETGYYQSISNDECIIDRIIFYGYKTGEELEEIYNKADIGLGVFGFYKTGGNYVSAIKCAEYLMRGLPVISAVDEEYLLSLKGQYFLSFPDDSSPIDMNTVVEFYESIYTTSNINAVHLKIRNRALNLVTITKVMSPVIERLTK